MFGTVDLGIDFSSGWALRLSELVAVAAGAAAAVTGLVILSTYVVGAVPLLAYLIAPAVPIVLIGQLWCIAILSDRAHERRQATGDTRWWSNGLRTRDLRGGLSTPAAIVFLVLLYGTLLLGPGAAIWGGETTASRGVPTDDPSTCEHSSNNHGDYRCLTDAEYEREQIEGTRWVAGVVFGFFIIHCGVASGEVLLRRQRAAEAVDLDGST